LSRLGECKLKQKPAYYPLLGIFFMNSYSRTAIIQKEEDMYIAKCPEVGTVSQGHSIEEALSNLKEATELYLEEFPKEST